MAALDPAELLRAHLDDAVATAELDVTRQRRLIDRLGRAGLLTLPAKQFLARVEAHAAEMAFSRQRLLSPQSSSPHANSPPLHRHLTFR